MKLKLSLLALVILALSGCATMQPGNLNSKRVPPGMWAFFDGDMIDTSKIGEFHAEHTIVTMDEHDLHTRYYETIDRMNGIRCLRQDCRLRPGVHTLGVEYYWSSNEAEEARERVVTRAGNKCVALMLLTFFDPETATSGTCARTAARLGSLCIAQIEFEAAIKRRYAIRVVHSDVGHAPKSIEIVDLETAASSDDRC